MLLSRFPASQQLLHCTSVISHGIERCYSPITTTAPDNDIAVSIKKWLTIRHSKEKAEILKSRNMRGLRTMWNQGQPLTFTKKWNPFTSDIPFTTYTSHPLLWHKEADDKERSIFNVDDFAYHLVQAVEKSSRPTSCAIEHKPIVLDNYVGLGSLIHNKNALGFYKIRGRFSF